MSRPQPTPDRNAQRSHDKVLSPWIGQTGGGQIIVPLSLYNVVQFPQQAVELSHQLSWTWRQEKEKKSRCTWNWCQGIHFKIPKRQKQNPHKVVSRATLSETDIIQFQTLSRCNIFDYYSVSVWHDYYPFLLHRASNIERLDTIAEGGNSSMLGGCDVTAGGWSAK